MEATTKYSGRHEGVTTTNNHKRSPTLIAVSVLPLRSASPLCLSVGLPRGRSSSSSTLRGYTTGILLLFYLRNYQQLLSVSTLRGLFYLRKYRHVIAHAHATPSPPPHPLLDSTWYPAETRPMQRHTPRGYAAGTCINEPSFPSSLNSLWAYHRDPSYRSTYHTFFTPR